ncbi:MAG: TolC family outer membrane protein [Alphaproteobacteria bacterium]
MKAARSVFAGLSAFCVLSLAATVSAETLPEALISAYQSNPGLMAERARVRELDENYVQAKGQGRFSSSFAASVGGSVLRIPSTNQLGQASGGHTISESVPASGQVQIIQPLYQGGRVRALKAQAKAGVLAAREGLRGAELNLFLSVATAYSQVQRDEEAARIRRNNVRVLSRQFQAANDRFEVGEGSRTDIAQAEARLAAADIGLAQADAQLQVSRAAYLRTVGHMPEGLSPVPSFVLPETEKAASIIARDNNPQILAAILTERGAEAAIDVAKSASKPVVSLNGTLSAVRGQTGIITKAQTGSVTAQVSIPIFSGGINRSRVRAAGHARTRLMFETRNIERNVAETVTQIWAQLDAAKRSLEAGKTQVKAAEFAFGGVELEQQLGTQSTLDVLNAEQEVLNAKLSVINAEASVDVAEFQLLAVLGAFDAESLQLSVEKYDPKANFDDVNEDMFSQTVDKYLPEVLKSD